MILLPSARVAWALLCGLALAAAGCSSDDGDGPTGPGNRAPTVSLSQGDLRIAFGNGDAVVITADADDPDNDPITVTWEIEGPGALDTATGEQVTWTADATVGETTLTATVDDGTTTASATLDFTVGTLIAADLTTDQTWTAEDGPYLIRDDLTVTAGTTLTLAAGTRVLFQGASNGSGGFVKPLLSILGTLDVEGTSGFLQNVEVSGGRALGSGVIQHRGIVFGGNGGGSLAYLFVRDGDVGVATQGSGPLDVWQSRFTENIVGFQAVGSHTPQAPVQLRRTRFDRNSGDGMFVSGGHVRVVNCSFDLNKAAGLSITAGTPQNQAASADADSCGFELNEGGNSRLNNTGGPLTLAINASNYDPGENGNNVVFGGCEFSFANTVDLTGNFWGTNPSATTADVLARMDGWNDCDEGLADWVKGVDWFAAPVPGAGF